MAHRLEDAVSPYLRAHADNPVDWWPWSQEAFDAASERDVPLLVSIGYSTCHWCHVMARESFSDPEIAALMNDRFVCIKVDREEHPEVDAAYLAAAGAFTGNLGWPLTVFATPIGRAFYAGTYFPPRPASGLPSFREVLDAVWEAWQHKRPLAEQTADSVAEAISAARVAADGIGGALPDEAAFARAVGAIAGVEDARHGGFGSAPKFPVAPALGFLLSRSDGRDLAVRTLLAMARSPLRDPVDGGFFRYATRPDWSEPHYERMLYDNAQLLRLYADASAVTADETTAAQLADAARGIAAFLTGTLRVDDVFASAQDSESIVAGQESEGGYYRLDAPGRAAQAPPGLDAKVLTGWNGLAVGALARAGFVLGEPAWVAAAGNAADWLLQHHLAAGGTLVRASVDGRASAASAALEDYGMLAGGLLDVFAATGERKYATVAKRLIDACLAAAGRVGSPFALPGGGDPVLAENGLSLPADPSEGAVPSGPSAAAMAAHRLFLITGDRAYEDAAGSALAQIVPAALEAPLSFGAALQAAAALAGGAQQLVVVGPALPAADDPLVAAARRWDRTAEVCLVSEQDALLLTSSGFALFADKAPRGGAATAYLCRDFVCRLPVTDAAGLADA